MQQPGVANVDTGRLDLTLPDVREPGREGPYHEGAGQDVEIPTRRAFVRAEGAGELRSVPYLAVVMGHHRPEPVKRLRGEP